jgi:hypothetical protein
MPIISFGLEYFLCSLNNRHYIILLKIGEKRKKLEEEKGIIIRFVIGHRWKYTMVICKWHLHGVLFFF